METISAVKVQMEVASVGATVKVHWSAAHRLLGHEGKCRFLHGHSWEAQVCFCGELRNNRLLHSDMMWVHDFRELKDRVKAVVSCFDHAVVLSKHDEELQRALARLYMPTVLLPGNPTAEMFALYILSALRNDGDSPPVQEVTVYESNEAWATVR